MYKSLKFLFVLSLLVPMLAQAQCRSYAKRYCLPSLSPYVTTGQLTTANVFEGDTAEVMLSFAAGQDYRVIVCSEEMLGLVEFHILDADRNLLYNSAKDEESKNYFDFNVAVSQNLIVELIVPKSEDKSHDIEIQGCLSLMVGFISTE